MIRFPENPRISGLRAESIRLTMNEGVGNFAKVSLVSDAGHPLALVTVAHFSPRTVRLIRQLAESVEMDAADLLRTPEELEDAWGPEEPVGDDSPSFSVGM